MSLINPSLEHVYCINLVSNRVLIRLIRFVSRFTIHLCNAIYFSTIFSTPCKRCTKNFVFYVLGSKQGLDLQRSPSPMCLFSCAALKHRICDKVWTCSDSESTYCMHLVFGFYNFQVLVTKINLSTSFSLA